MCNFILYGGVRKIHGMENLKIIEHNLSNYVRVLSQTETRKTIYAAAFKYS